MIIKEWYDIQCIGSQNSELVCLNEGCSLPLLYKYTNNTRMTVFNYIYGCL